MATINGDNATALLKADDHGYVGAVWVGNINSNNGEQKALKTIKIELKPGTYTINEGDSIMLIGYLNEFKKDNEKAPTFRMKVKKVSASAGE